MSSDVAAADSTAASCATTPEVLVAVMHTSATANVMIFLRMSSHLSHRYLEADQVTDLYYTKLNPSRLFLQGPAAKSYSHTGDPQVIGTLPTPRFSEARCRFESCQAHHTK